MITTVLVVGTSSSSNTAVSFVVELLEEAFLQQEEQFATTAAVLWRTSSSIVALTTTESPKSVSKMASTVEDVVMAAACIILCKKREFKRRFWVRPSLKARTKYSGTALLTDLARDDVDPLTGEIRCDDTVGAARTEHMNSEEKDAITKLAREYSDIFHIDGNYLTFTSKIKHHIRTSDEIPIYTKSYRYPEIHRKEVQRQIQSMLDQKIIRESHSAWCSPIWIVPKKLDASGKQKWRIVIDYRKLNEKTLGDRYPLPNITDLLDKLGRCQYFSTLDLASGFHQIEMAEDDIQKTAFNTENGHYEFTRMPFGLKNAPATFQRVMDNILRGIQNEKCLVYLDDIIIFSTSLQEHISRLREVFERLRQSNFKIQLDKSEFLRKEVSYLGHVVTADGVKPNPDKIKAITEFKIPKTKKQIKGFLGLLGYYRKFIKDFAKITKPLTIRLKKDAIINPNDADYIKCFELCKTLLTNDPILQYPDFSQPFLITTDASNYAIGAILSQGKLGSDLPIAYASRTLSDSETKYSTTEKELLSIVYAVKYFRPYIFGRKFTIVTDHKSLQWLFSVRDASSKLLRWRLRLEEHDFDIVYRKGKSNTNADFYLE
ncbi:unnamed protein product [Acanthoscelides obtectus]|uniref:RNA-directed DNA polymerase n=1 Tax=Acanthoscelides obtectus TaxID=200917 RepID=A0A9P0Q8E7_ACAOB|nr:unnamed protein product [Acanthoscelides obtectus]CAK1621650.1 Retrovirus-related Pol polyprotein from transposon 17.6 [Acanthoscelides obtectus]